MAAGGGIKDAFKNETSHATCCGASENSLNFVEQVAPATVGTVLGAVAGFWPEFPQGHLGEASQVSGERAKLSRFFFFAYIIII